MHQKQSESRRPLRVAISGASGLIGSRLAKLLTDHGHHVQHLVRDRARLAEGDIFWNPATGEVDAAGLEASDALVHLAGENVASGRWNAARKAAIRDSRVAATRKLCARLAGMDHPPRVLIAASAVGYYGDCGELELTEESPAGEGFLAGVARDVESACDPARAAGLRVVNLRIGIVLARAGGALARMLTPFRRGLGGKVGRGRQYLSWIAREDLVRACEHLLLADDVRGPVNGVAPNPVTNAEFTRTLGRVLGRPTIMPLPSAMVRLLFGEMGEELLLASTRVLPTRLTASGFAFQCPELQAALRTELGLDS